MIDDTKEGIRIHPLTLHQFWHRRICQAVFLLAFIVAALYAWGKLEPAFAQSLFAVDTLTAVLAVGTMLVGAIVYFVPERNNYFWLSYACFGLLFITVVFLLQASGELDSPFRVMFTILALCGGVFGIYAALPIFAILLIYGIGLYAGGMLTQTSIILLALMGGLPLLTGYIIWRARRSIRSDGPVKKLESELSQITSKSDVVINAIADGVIALDKDGKLQLINPAAQRLLGWSRTDALRLSYKSVIKLVDMENKYLSEVADPVANVLTTNQQVARNDLQVLTKGRKQLQVALDISPVGQLGAGLIIVFRDITKEKSDEREQTEFISTASHEMRTPVASIEGYLGLALNPAIVTIDDKAREYIEKAHASVEHLGRLFQDLLDVTKADDGRLSNTPKVVDVVEFLSDVVQGLVPKAEKKGLRMVYKPRPETGVVLAGRRITPVFFANVDNDHLREVIANLIENAIKYTPSGTVSVDVTGDSDHVVICIEDSGIGIPSEDIVHLFQKFYRVDNGETREIGGTGLGLYLCRRLCEAMGGRVWVESRYKQGSTFYVELRRVSHEDAMRLIETSRSQTSSTEQLKGTLTLQKNAPLPQKVPSELPAPIGPVGPSKKVAPPITTPITPDSPILPTQPAQLSSSAPEISQQISQPGRPSTKLTRIPLVAPAVTPKPVLVPVVTPSAPPVSPKKPMTNRVAIPKRTFDYTKHYGPNSRVAEERRNKLKD